MEKLKAIAKTIQRKNQKAIESFLADISGHTIPTSTFKISKRSQQNLLHKPSLNSESKVFTEKKISLLCELRSLDIELKKA